ncbi:MAG: hypothetical protein FJ336_07470 [Sphingomonadales bacterium]|nr:hypothetical protein [Sphingomonadales bacterium]
MTFQHDPNSKEFKKEQKNLVDLLLAENPESSRYFLEILVYCYLTDPDAYEKLIAEHLEEKNIVKNIDDKNRGIPEVDAIQGGTISTEG